MRELYCWRCDQVMPILDDEEYAIIYQLFLEGVERRRSGVPAEEAMKIVREVLARHLLRLLQLLLLRDSTPEWRYVEVLCSRDWGSRRYLLFDVHF